MHPPEMTLHPLTSKGGAFVSKLGLVFKKSPTAYAVGDFLASDSGGIRKGGTSAHTGAKIESGRAIFSPWENPLAAERRQYACELLSILSR